MPILIASYKLAIAVFVVGTGWEVRLIWIASYTCPLYLRETCNNGICRLNRVGSHANMDCKLQTCNSGKLKGVLSFERGWQLCQYELQVTNLQ